MHGACCLSAMHMKRYQCLQMTVLNRGSPGLLLQLPSFRRGRKSRPRPSPSLQCRWLPMTSMQGSQRYHLPPILQHHFCAMWVCILFCPIRETPELFGCFPPRMLQAIPCSCLSASSCELVVVSQSAEHKRECQSMC